MSVEKKPYWTLVCRHEIDGIWCIEFGDWERESVEFEREELRSSGVQRRNLKIIRTMAKDDHAFEIGEQLRMLNEGDERRDPTDAPDMQVSFD